jgi:hypothetical protein
MQQQQQQYLAALAQFPRVRPHDYHRITPPTPQSAPQGAPTSTTSGVGVDYYPLLDYYTQHASLDQLEHMTRLILLAQSKH